MRVSLVLHDPHRNWETVDCAEGQIHVCGCLFSDNSLLRARDLPRLLGLADDAFPCAPLSSKTLVNALRRLDGHFALIIQQNDATFAAVDRIRSYPLFYSVHSGVLTLTDSLAEETLCADDDGLNLLAAYEYLRAGYVTGNDTLSTRHCQLQAGQYLHASHDHPESPRVKHYYRFLRDPETADCDRTECSARFEQAVQTALKRLRAFAQDRTVCVPLSGGWDSRLIAAALRLGGFDHVVCFSYGSQGNEESRISKAVAEALGFAWRFAPYSATRWSDWIRSQEAREHWAMSSNVCSLPCFQDFLAAKELLTDAVKPDAAVFVPGHTGDFLSGGHTPIRLLQVGRSSIEAVVREICRKHFCFWPDEAPPSCILERLTRQTGEAKGALLAPEEAVRICEMWEFSERQAKYIVNSVRVYEFLGSAWYLPLWDSGLIDLFTSLRLGARLHQRSYIESILDCILTGPASALRTIPITGSGRTPDNWGFSAPCTRRRGGDLARAALGTLGLLPSLRAIRRCFSTPRCHPLGFHDWFAGGRSPGQVKLRESLGDLFTDFAPVRPLLEFHGSKTLRELDCLGILAMHTLCWLVSRKGHAHA